MPERLRSIDALTDPELPLSVKRHLVNWNVADHGHEFQEMVYVERGRSEHDVAIEGERRAPRRFTLLPGDCFLIAPGERHAYVEPRNLVVWNIIFEPRVFGSEADALRSIPGLAEFLFVEPLFRHEGRTMAKVHLGVGEREGVLACLQGASGELKQRLDGFRVAARAQFLHLLVLLARAWRRQHPSGAGTSGSAQAQAVAAATAFMEEHFGEDLSLRAIADQALLSPHHFSEVFKRHCGMPPWDFLLQLRLGRAKELLASSDRQVTDIALEVGFGDSSYFARVFKAQTGMTPRAWRQRERPR